MVTSIERTILVKVQARRYQAFQYQLSSMHAGFHNRLNRLIKTLNELIRRKMPFESSRSSFLSSRLFPSRLTSSSIQRIKQNFLAVDVFNAYSAITLLFIFILKTRRYTAPSPSYSPMTDSDEGATIARRLLHLCSVDMKGGSISPKHCSQLRHRCEEDCFTHECLKLFCEHSVAQGRCTHMRKSRKLLAECSMEFESWIGVCDNA